MFDGYYLDIIFHGIRKKNSLYLEIIQWKPENNNDQNTCLA
jgi:hypothetical protein